MEGVLNKVGSSLSSILLQDERLERASEKPLLSRRSNTCVSEGESWNYWKMFEHRADLHRGFAPVLEMWAFKSPIVVLLLAEYQRPKKRICALWSP